MKTSIIPKSYDTCAEGDFLFFFRVLYVESKKLSTHVRLGSYGVWMAEGAQEIFIYCFIQFYMKILQNGYVRVRVNGYVTVTTDN
jgi:hypothetical protein